MIFCSVEAYFPWGKKGALKEIEVQKGVLKIFHADFLKIRPSLQMFVNGPLGLGLGLNGSIF